MTIELAILLLSHALALVVGANVAFALVWWIDRTPVSELAGSFTPDDDDDEAYGEVINLPDGGYRVIFN